MHCKSCEILLEKSISQISGVKKVEVSQKLGIAEVEFSHGIVAEELIAQAVNDAGYTLGHAKKLPWVSRNPEEWMELLLGTTTLLFFWMVGNTVGIFDTFGTNISATPTYPIIFIIGLTAGVSTCMAVVGGLVAGFSASYAQKHQYATRWERFKPHLFFNIGRLLSYAILGGVIGSLGSVVTISTGFTGVLVAVSGLVMVVMGMKLTDISPKLSNTNITLPKKISQMLGIHKNDGEYSHAQAFIGGILTFFLPCGFTQAVQVYAITTGSFATGAIVMFLFALGTMPGLVGIGALTTLLQGKGAKIIFRFIGLIVLILGIVNLSNGISASGIQIPSPFDMFGNKATTNEAIIENGEQVVKMIQSAGGYSPNKFIVKKGIPVRWVIDSQNAYTCAASLRMPQYNIAQFLKEGENVITFTPTQAGVVRFMCSMGMYSGTFTVVE